MSDKDLGEYLKEVRESLGYSTHDINKLCEISQSYISLMENGKRKPSPIILKKLSDTYFLDFIDLLKRAGYDELIDFYKNSGLDKLQEINTPVKNKILLRKQKFYNCPVYGQISAGQPNWAEECLEGYLPLDPELMDIVDPEEHYFLRVNGESMNKVIRNGAFALIHKQETVENGEIAVVLVNGDNATLKRFSKQNDIIVLTPESTDDSFEQQIYTKDTRIQVIGKYVGKMEFNK